MEKKIWAASFCNFFRIPRNHEKYKKNIILSPVLIISHVTKFDTLVSFDPNPFLFSSKFFTPRVRFFRSQRRQHGKQIPEPDNTIRNPNRMDRNRSNGRRYGLSSHLRRLHTLFLRSQPISPKLPLSSIPRRQTRRFTFPSHKLFRRRFHHARSPLRR
jgi:hypothetical protein